jgi:hypothetical protein
MTTPRRTSAGRWEDGESHEANARAPCAHCPRAVVPVLSPAVMAKKSQQCCNIAWFPHDSGSRCCSASRTHPPLRGVGHSTPSCGMRPHRVWRCSAVETNDVRLYSAACLRRDHANTPRTVPPSIPLMLPSPPVVTYDQHFPIADTQVVSATTLVASAGPHRGAGGPSPRTPHASASASGAAGPPAPHTSPPGGPLMRAWGGRSAP